MLILMSLYSKQEDKDFGLNGKQAFLELCPLLIPSCMQFLCALQNCEKRLLGMSRPSVRPYGTTGISLE